MKTFLFLFAHCPFAWHEIHGKNETKKKAFNSMQHTNALHIHSCRVFVRDNNESENICS